MSFEARQLMVDLPPFAQPGLVLCGQATAGGRDEEEDADVECGQATANEPTAVAGNAEDDLALLRQQLRHALASEPPL
jgi:hypothetical protein